ncbi:MAG: divergent PAP2 family protein [Chloroflexi bacterium]|nr:divergent PAP2 family protein [Chloroflexota bacterium]
MFYEVITNEALVIPISAWAIAQLTKTSIALLQGKGLDFRYLVSSGGMPSAHSALVTSLATTVGMTQGFGSTVFGITVILALIVMYDAAGVRQSVSQQSVVLNRIVRELRLRHSITNLEADMRELLGHTPFQVIVGAFSGFALAWLWITIAAM